MANNKIKYYPVNNGDTSLITLKDDTTIQIDCNIREGEKDSDDNYIYDVKEDLLSSIQKRNSNPYLNLFILTHPDEDHCRGFKKNYYQGDPDNYSESNRNNHEIIVDEIWVTSAIFSSDLSDDANAIRNEVNRRKRLSEIEKNKKGNHLILIGYDEEKKLEGVTNYVPGTEINVIDGSIKENFSFFIHAPFKKDLIESKADNDRNSSSIVLQARFKDSQLDDDHKTFAIFGGDADHYIWEKIIEKTEGNDNHKYLKWDILLAPHHCSWTFFNDVPYSNVENQEAKDYSLRLLEEYQEGKGKVIASSKKIVKEKPNPPHQAAKDKYLKKINSDDDFIELAINPSENRPEPIEFLISNNGATKLPEKAKVAITTGGALGAPSTVVKNG
ncbi:MAG: cobyric acid synthase CobQ [Bacteroidota bacterium]